MTVAELIAKLQEMPADAEIVYYEPPGYYESTHATKLELYHDDEVAAMVELEEHYDYKHIERTDDEWEDFYEEMEKQKKVCVCIGDPYG